MTPVGEVPPSDTPPPPSKRLGPIVFAVAFVAVAAFVAVWWPWPKSTSSFGPIVKVSDISRIRGGKADDPSTAARSTVERLLRSIDDRDVKTFTALAGSVDAAGSPKDADVLREQLEFLHLKYGGRPHRIGAVVATAMVDGDGKVGPTRFPVGVLFGDREDLLTIDVDAAGHVVSLHEDDPLTFAEPEGGDAPTK